MKKLTYIIFTVFLFEVILAGCIHTKSKDVTTPDNFMEPIEKYGVHAWWHWMDGNITKDGIRKDLEAMAQQGITQVTILNVSMYGQQFHGLKNIEFDTPEWYEMFRYVLAKADSLHITVGAQNCDGWSTSGGPWITPEYGMKEISWTKTLVSGGVTVQETLPQPYSLHGFYRDVAVVAIKTGNKSSRFIQAVPAISTNGKNTNQQLFDGCPVGGAMVKEGDALTIDFKDNFETNKISIHPRKKFMWGSTNKVEKVETSYSLEAKNASGDFVKVADFKIEGFNKTVCINIPEIKSMSFRLKVTGMSNHDEFYISELELLKDDELPMYFSDILNHQAKTESVQNASAEQYFNVTENEGTNRLIQPENIVDISKNVDGDGNLNWDVPDGEWEIIRFGYTITGQTNFPATATGLGLECDKMDTTAFNIHFNNYPQKLIDRAGKYTGNTFKFLLVDSWECLFQNWTKTFPEEFEKLNGYSIIEWIPVLCGEVVESSKNTESFLYDYRRTIATLIETNYFKHFSEQCHRSGLEMHGEVIYGGPKLPPLDVLKAYSYTDMPMFEFWARDNKELELVYEEAPERISHFASSAALFYDKKSVGSEAYTGHASYSESPWKLKPYGDRAYCSGINQMILHSYIHQPTDSIPGIAMNYFFGQPFNRLNSYWEQLSGWTKYQARIQSILQNATDANDVLFYVGDRFPQFSVNLADLPDGYGSNVCNFDILQNKLQVKNHKIEFRDGVSFSLLVLPKQEGMNYQALLRLKEMIENGAYVYGEKPLCSYSLADEKNHREDFERIVQQIWGNNPDEKNNIVEYGKGRVLWGMSLKKALEEVDVPADFKTSPENKNDFSFIHKRTNDKDIYFVANQLNQPVSVQCEFRINGKIPQVWNPLTGEITSVDYSSKFQSTLVPFNFKPLEAVFFVFQDEVGQENSGEKEILNEFEITKFEGTINFHPVYKADIQPVKINELIPLSDFGEPEIKYFAGKARYSISFMMDQPVEPGKEYYLNLGSFDAVASVVSMNGNDIGDLWSPQQELKITNHIQQGINKLDITIAIPYRNRILGDLNQYGELKSFWTSCDIASYMKADLPLMKVGLIGPMKIISKEK